MQSLPSLYIHLNCYLIWDSRLIQGKKKSVGDKSWLQYCRHSRSETLAIDRCSLLLWVEIFSWERYFTLVWGRCVEQLLFHSSLGGAGQWGNVPCTPPPDWNHLGILSTLSPLPKTRSPAVPAPCTFLDWSDPSLGRVRRTSFSQDQHVSCRETVHFQFLAGEWNMMPVHTFCLMPFIIKSYSIFLLYLACHRCLQVLCSFLLFLCFRIPF